MELIVANSAPRHYHESTDIFQATKRQLGTIHPSTLELWGIPHDRVYVFDCNIENSMQ